MQNIEKLIANFLAELEKTDRETDRGPGGDNGRLEAKIAEFRTLLSTLAPQSRYLLDKFDRDAGLQNGTGDLRRKSLLAYARTTLKLLREDVIHPRLPLLPVPDFTVLTRSIPGLDDLLKQRWREAQICQRDGAYLAAILQMGSMLQALLLARVMYRPADAARARRSPKNINGDVKPFQDWSVTELLAVAIELKWVRVKPADFHVALRKYQHLLHPLEQLSAQITLDEDVCRHCWQVVTRCAADLPAST